jgi:hypothetical protein
MTSEAGPSPLHDDRLAVLEATCRHQDAQVIELAGRLHDSVTTLTSIHLALRAGHVDSAADMAWLAITQVIDVNERAVRPI